ncbi:hypothetical protein RMATCC62417_04526 [Rhizopus microsporus]|nr:hypothetical protein RMATCC62417_04526 [Rhizopus microsporus]
MNLWLRRLPTHSEYLKHPACCESSRTCPILVEKSKEEDIRMKKANMKRDYIRYTVQDRARFFDLKIERCTSASAAAKQLGIYAQTAQRRRILTEEHKTTVINFIDTNPSATVVEIINHLLKRFSDIEVSRSAAYNFMKSECNLSLKKADFHSIGRNSPAKIEEWYDWVRKWENTDMNFLTSCVFLDEAAFDINMKPSSAWSQKGTRAIATRPTMRANTASILSAISATGLITAGVRKPRPTKKRKVDGYIDSGTVTSHFISFLKMTLDEMYKHPHMKGHYIIMDYAPIHTHENIKKYTEYRGYKCVYLPTYSPKLNPIEQFWAVAKSKVKRHRFLQEDALSKRITEACKRVETKHFKGFVSHSYKCWDKCRGKEIM